MEYRVPSTDFLLHKTYLDGVICYHQENIQILSFLYNLSQYKILSSLVVFLDCCTIWVFLGQWVSWTPLKFYHRIKDSQQTPDFYWFTSTNQYMEHGLSFCQLCVLKQRVFTIYFHILCQKYSYCNKSKPSIKELHKCNGDTVCISIENIIKVNILY